MEKIVHQTSGSVTAIQQSNETTTSFEDRRMASSVASDIPLTVSPQSATDIRDNSGENESAENTRQSAPRQLESTSIKSFSQSSQHTYSSSSHLSEPINAVPMVEPVVVTDQATLNSNSVPTTKSLGQVGPPIETIPLLSISDIPGIKESNTKATEITNKTADNPSNTTVSTTPVTVTVNPASQTQTYTYPMVTINQPSSSQNQPMYAPVTGATLPPVDPNKTLTVEFSYGSALSANFAPPLDLIDPDADSTYAPDSFTSPSAEMLTQSYSFHDYPNPAHYASGHTILKTTGYGGGGGIAAGDGRYIVAPVRVRKVRIERDYDIDPEICRFRLWNEVCLAVLGERGIPGGAATGIANGHTDAKSSDENRLERIKQGLGRKVDMPSWVIQYEKDLVREVNNRIPIQRIDQTISTINEMINEAESINVWNVLDNLAGFVTGWSWQLCFSSYYDRCLNRITEYVNQENAEIYHPKKLHLRDPRKTAFMSLEIEFLADNS